MPDRPRRFVAFALVLLSAAAPRLLALPEPPATPATSPATPATPATPSKAAQVFSEQVEVHVVNLEVFAADRNGKPVADLKREDFEVLEDGKPVPLTNFYASEKEARPGAPAPGTPAASAPATTSPGARPEDQRLHLVVFVDDVNTVPGNRNRMLALLGDFFDRTLEPGDVVMLVRYDGVPKVVRPFTGDRGLLRSDILALSKHNPLGVTLKMGTQKEMVHGGFFQVPVQVSIPIANLTLVPDGDSRVGHLRLFVVASGNGETTPVKTSETEIRIPEAKLAKGGLPDYVHEVRITLKPGEYAVGIGVRDDLGAATSYLKGTVKAGR